jgi:heme/copper-type cytochrome/quinol oxidase subunit 4
MITHPRKNIAPQYQGMWWSSVLNIVLCYVNIAFLYSGLMRTGEIPIISLISAIISIILAIVMFLKIKRLSTEDMWRKLAYGRATSN